jgi:hypothetical protein
MSYFCIAVVRDAPDVKRTKTQAITTTKPRKTTTISLEPRNFLAI